jgi:hypothetical protein
MFSLFNLIFLSVAIMLDNLIGWTAPNIGFGPLYGIYILVVAIPSIAVSVRRLHDTGSSGWLVLVGLVPVVGQVWFLVKMLQDGTQGENRFGRDPKESTTGDLVSTEYTDSALVFTILWIILANIFYRVLPAISPEYYSETWFLKTSIVLNFIWSLLPILIAIAIRNKTMQIILFGLGALYLVYGWLQLILDSTNPILV